MSDSLRAKILLAKPHASFVGSPQPASPTIRPPRGWLGLAFLGIWIYFLSQVFQLYEGFFAEGAGLTEPEAISVLRITSNLGEILFLSGVVAALWRANLAAGPASGGTRGLALGSASVGLLVFFEAVLLLDWMEIATPLIRSVGLWFGLGSIVAVALGLAGIASLGVALSRAVGLFGVRAEPRAALRWDRRDL